MAWPHPETYTFDGIDKPLDKISVGDLTKYLSRKSMTQPKILKNWEKDLQQNPGWIREGGRESRARVQRPDRPHDSSSRFRHKVETSNKVVPPQEWIDATRAIQIFSSTHNHRQLPLYCRHILHRKLVLRRQLKAYGLDTTTHTRCRLCHKTSETLRHLDVCPVVRAVFAQGESLNIQPPRLLTVIGTSADTPEVHNALHLHMWNQIIVSFYEEEDIKPEHTWMEGGLKSISEKHASVLGRGQNKAPTNKTQERPSQRLDHKRNQQQSRTHGDIDYYGRLRLSRRVNDELKRVGLDHLTTEEATTRAREIRFVKASRAGTPTT